MPYPEPTPKDYMRAMWCLFVCWLWRMSLKLRKAWSYAILPVKIIYWRWFWKPDDEADDE